MPALDPAAAGRTLDEISHRGPARDRLRLRAHRPPDLLLVVGGFFCVGLWPPNPGTLSPPLDLWIMRPPPPASPAAAPNPPPPPPPPPPPGGVVGRAPGGGGVGPPGNCWNAEAVPGRCRPRRGPPNPRVLTAVCGNRERGCALGGPGPSLAWGLLRPAWTRVDPYLTSRPFRPSHRGLPAAFAPHGACARRTPQLCTGAYAPLALRRLAGYLVPVLRPPYSRRPSRCPRRPAGPASAGRTPGRRATGQPFPHYYRLTSPPRFFHRWTGSPLVVGW